MAPPQLCAAITDMTILTGIAAANGGDYQALPYIAANNDIQSGIVHPMSGRYRVTGEVIDIQNVHPGFSGRVIVLYEMQRIGDGTLADDVMASAERDKRAVVDGIREQLRVHPSECDSYAELKEQQNPISSASNSETDTEDGESGQGGTGELTADGTWFSIISRLLGVLLPYLAIRRRNR